MQINIDKILMDKQKTRYWLSKNTGYSYPNLMKLCNNEKESIRFDILFKICESLECTPNDIFGIKY